MKVLDGTREGFVRACRMIADSPHPDHMREFEQVTGRTPDIEDMLVDSVSGAEVGAYAIRGADALVGGISASGLVKREIWFLTTATAKEHRKWLLREARRMLRLADDYFEPLAIFGQVIPVDYPEGVNFARHLGFQAFGYVVGPHKDKLAIMERCGLWARKR